MLIGTASLDDLAARAPRLERWPTELVVLAGAEVLQVAYEMPGNCREVLLPPALHPTDPPIVTWLFYRCPTSPWGGFSLAQTRIECRSGVRLRAFTIGAVIDNETAAAALRGNWGYPLRSGIVALQRHYDAICGAAEVGGVGVLDVRVIDPDPLSADDVQYVASMHCAHTPLGLRLLQVEVQHRLHRAERGRPLLAGFDATAWGDERVRPVHPVSASFATADVILPRIRFACRADVLAFEGTETIS